MFDGVGYLLYHLPLSSRSFYGQLLVSGSWDTWKVGNVNKEITTSDTDETLDKYIREKRIMRER